jgi:chromosome segregation ATPase
VDEPIKKQAEALRATILALQKQCKAHEEHYTDLQFYRSLIGEELDEAMARAAKSDQRVADAKAQLEESQAELEKQRRALSQIEGGQKSEQAG